MSDTPHSYRYLLTQNNFWCLTFNCYHFNTYIFRHFDSLCVIPMTAATKTVDVLSKKMTMKHVKKYL